MDIDHLHRDAVHGRRPCSVYRDGARRGRQGFRDRSSFLIIGHRDEPYKVDTSFDSAMDNMRNLDSARFRPPFLLACPPTEWNRNRRVDDAQLKTTRTSSLACGIKFVALILNVVLSSILKPLKGDSLWAMILLEFSVSL